LLLPKSNAITARTSRNSQPMISPRMNIVGSFPLALECRRPPELSS
jgi:hypothetical protein